MINIQKLVFNELLSIQKKHSRYLQKNGIDIFNSIDIIWELPVSIHVTLKALPFEIKWDIEAMFWVE